MSVYRKCSISLEKITMLSNEDRHMRLCEVCCSLASEDSAARINCHDINHSSFAGVCAPLFFLDAYTSSYRYQLILTQHYRSPLPKAKGVHKARRLYLVPRRASAGKHQDRSPEGDHTTAAKVSLGVCLKLVVGMALVFTEQ
jgi:hypothetical protein